MTTLWYASQDWIWVLLVVLAAVFCGSVGSLVGYGFWIAWQDIRDGMRQRHEEKYRAEMETADLAARLIHRAIYPTGHPQAAGLKSDRRHS